MVYLFVLTISMISFREESLKRASLYCGVSLRTPLPSDADFKQKLRCSRKPATFNLEFEQDVLNVIVGCNMIQRRQEETLKVDSTRFPQGPNSIQQISQKYCSVLICTYFLLFPFPNIGLPLLYFLKMNCGNIHYTGTYMY